MSTQSSIQINYKLASGAIYKAGYFCGEDGYELEFHNEYFFNDWCENNLEQVPQHPDEFWLPFEKILEFIEKANKTLALCYSKDTSEIVKFFPHIKAMSDYGLSHSSITFDKGQYIYGSYFYSDLSQIVSKLAPVMSLKGNPDILLSFCIYK